MKKLILTTAAFALLSAGVMAQNQTLVKGKKAGMKVPVAGATNSNNASTTPPVVINRGCGTAVPNADWDKAFNEAVEQWKAQHIDAAGRITSINHYTVSVIMHVIHSGQAVGTYPNLSYAQLKSQVDVLNADYAGIGNATSTYTALTSSGHGPFYDYAQANSLPSPDNTSAGILPQNTGITFCMATKDPTGATLTEPGVERINYTSTLVGPTQTHVYPITHYTTSTYSDPNPASTIYKGPTAGSGPYFTDFVDNVIKPNTIWPIGKYLNIWVTAENNSVGLLGYATFPAGTGLTGLAAPYGSTTTDGFWTVAYGCGNTATGAGWTSPAAVTKSTGSPANTEYNMGRTCSHEIGHYFGLRHTWGDGACLTDYCNDTPPEGGATYYGPNNTPANSAWVYPYTGNNTCSGTGSYNSDSGDGIMYMDFMDYSDDKFMCMFTNDQVARIQTTMANGTYRSTLNAAAATECATTTSTVAPTAAFTLPSSICASQAAAFTDASTGGPTSWAWSSNPSTGVTFNTATSENPTITFPTAGTYTVTLAASNSVGPNSISHAVTVTSCTTSSCDTMSNMLSTDTLTFYEVTKGYMSGSSGVATNSATPTVATLTAQAVGELYSSSSFPTNVNQVKGAMILFYRDVAHNIGTKGTSGTITVNMTNTSSNSTGTIPGTTTSATQTVSIASIVSHATTAGVDYAGNTLFDYTGYLIAYPVMFTSAVTMPSAFALTVSTPTAVPADTIAIWSNSGVAQSTATGCVQYKSSTATNWYNAGAFGVYPSFAIIPIVCPATATGIEGNHLGSSINLFPNPNSGQFNFAVTLDEATNLNFTIVNMLGQAVYTRTENNVTNTVLSVDLSNLAKGIYYANITDSNNNKTVKKIIIQ